MNITAKVGAAGKVFLAAQNITSIPNIYAELEDADNEDGNTAAVRNIPCAVCYGTDPQENPPRSGNYRLNLHVLVEASFDDTTADSFIGLCKDIFSVIHTSTIHSDLTDALDDFTCIAIAGAASQAPGIDAQRRLRRCELVIPIYACASDIAA